MCQRKTLFLFIFVSSLKSFLLAENKHHLVKEVQESLQSLLEGGPQAEKATANEILEDKPEEDSVSYGMVLFEKIQTLYHDAMHNVNDAVAPIATSLGNAVGHLLATVLSPITGGTAADSISSHADNVVTNVTDQIIDDVQEYFDDLSDKNIWNGNRYSSHLTEDDYKIVFPKLPVTLEASSIISHDCGDHLEIHCQAEFALGSTLNLKYKIMKPEAVVLDCDSMTITTNEDGFKVLTWPVVKSKSGLQVDSGSYDVQGILGVSFMKKNSDS